MYSFYSMFIKRAAILNLQHGVVEVSRTFRLEILTAASMLIVTQDSRRNKRSFALFFQVSISNSEQKNTLLTLSDVVLSKFTYSGIQVKFIYRRTVKIKVFKDVFHGHLCVCSLCPY